VHKTGLKPVRIPISGSKRQ